MIEMIQEFVKLKVQVINIQTKLLHSNQPKGINFFMVSNLLLFFQPYHMETFIFCKVDFFFQGYQIQTWNASITSFPSHASLPMCIFPSFILLLLSLSLPFIIVSALFFLFFSLM